ncbi:unnamed protein product [Ostreobium quekettii]|uniref:Transmembrane protein 231 n=1 Tax=Ostreobium quekettii TaxID=121088 RepID=A0A8S1J438_9CHLO|nr:unnamed protein product [Ostreobium quekettii]
MVQVYCEAYCRRHHARRLSAANAVLVGGHAAALALACLLAHASGGLWDATRTRVEQPRVAFAYDALLVMEGSTAGSEKVWSSFPGIRSTLGSKLVAAHMQASEHDNNFDGITDQITVDLLAKGVGDVHSLKLLLQFDYRLEVCATRRSCNHTVRAARSSPGSACSRTPVTWFPCAPAFHLRPNGEPVVPDDPN